MESKGNTMKKRKILIPLMIVMSISLAYILYIQSVCNADEAGTYAYMYSYFELGNMNLSLKDFLNPWFYCSAIAYLLNIGGSGSTISISYLAVWYGIAVFFTLLLCMYKTENKWLLALAFFILMPYELTNKYHMVAAFVTLFTILGMQYYNDYRKKWMLFLIVLVDLYTLLFTNDRVILILFVFSTVVIYYGILILQDKNKRNYLYIVAFAVALGAMILKCIDIISIIFRGKELGITNMWGGYGGSEYLTWIDIHTLFDKGIPSFFSSLFIQWNIPIEGGMIQFNSFYWIVRIVIALLALVALISRWVEIVKKGIRNVKLLDSLSVICVTVVALINVLNGMVWYYDIENSPMNRYASVCWFLLVVILIRWISERYHNRMINNRISTNTVLGLSFIMLSIGYVGPIYKGNTDIINRYCENELAYLNEQGDNYQYGLASFWKSTPITAATNAECVVSPGWIEDGKLTCNDNYGFYTDGSNYFNFLISDPENEMTMSPESIEAIRGDYIDTYSNTSRIYLYDYDIRFDTTIVMDTAGTGYEMTDTLTYYLDLPVGTSRVEITSPQRDNLLLAVQDNEEITDVKIGVKEEDIATVEFTCLQNTQIALSVGRKEDILTQLYKIEIKRTAGAVEVNNHQTAIPLNEGSYIITFNGGNLKDMNVKWNTDVMVKQLTKGNVKKRYLVTVLRKQDVEFEIVENGANIDNIYYENENLFE